MTTLNIGNFIFMPQRPVFIFIILCLILNASLPDFQQTVYDENFLTPNFLKGGIMYQIFPDRFFNSKTPKKNVPKSRVMRDWGDTPFWKEEQMNGIWNNYYFGGDLKGIKKSLQGC